MQGIETIKDTIYRARNGNECVLGRSKCYHYYIAISFRGIRVSPWHRVSLEFINKYYTKVKKG